MRNSVKFYEENGETKVVLSARTVNKVARELAHMYEDEHNLPIWFPWEVIAECLRGQTKEPYKESFVWTLLEYMEDERFEKIDGMAMNIMVENLLHLECSDG